MRIHLLGGVSVETLLSVEYRSLISFQRMLSLDWLSEQPVLGHPHSHSDSEGRQWGLCTLESHSSGFKSQFYHLLAGSLWKSYFTCLWPSTSLSIKQLKAIATSKVSCEGKKKNKSMKVSKTVLAHKPVLNKRQTL